jgi:ankyrin repeat protein
MKNINLPVILFFLLAEINGTNYDYDNELHVKLLLKEAKGEIHDTVRFEIIQYIQELLDSVQDTLSDVEREKLKFFIKDHLKELYHKSAVLMRCEQQANISCWQERKLLKYEVSNFKKQVSDYIEQVIRETGKHYSLKDYLTAGSLIAAGAAIVAVLQKLWHNMNSAEVKGDNQRNERFLPPGQNQQPPSFQIPPPHSISGESLESIMSPLLQSTNEKQLQSTAEDTRIANVYRAIEDDNDIAFYEALASLKSTDDINKTIYYDHRHFTLLYAVARHTNNLNMAKELVKRGALINWRGKEDMPSLASALIHGHDEVARYLIELGPNIKEVTIDGKPILLWFFMGILVIGGRDEEVEKDLDMLRYMLEKGASVNQIVKNETVFYHALNNFHYVFKLDHFRSVSKATTLYTLLGEMMKYVDFTQPANRKAVYIAVQNNNEHLVDMLLEVGAPYDEPHEDDINTPLQVATINGNLNIVKQLLAKGADRFFENRHGKNAIELAKEHNKCDILKEFMRNYLVIKTLFTDDEIGKLLEEAQEPQGKVSSLMNQIINSLYQNLERLSIDP